MSLSPRSSMGPMIVLEDFPGEPLNGPNGLLYRRLLAGIAKSKTGTATVTVWKEPARP